MDRPHAVQVSLTGAANGPFVVSEAEPLNVGRSARAVVYDLTVSRVHCRIQLGPQGLEVVDLDSHNGTWINGENVTRAPLEDGDELRIGDATLQVDVSTVDALAFARSSSSTPSPSASDPFQTAYLCASCGRDISLETFADGEVLEEGGCFHCPQCVAARAYPTQTLDLTATFAQLERDGFRDLKVLSVPSASLFLNATRIALDQPVTLKVLHTDATPEEHTRRFVRETRIAARLSHPNIVRVFDVICSDDLIYIVLERIEGITLLEDIELHGPIPPRRLLALAVPIANAIAYLHEQDVVHRDIKPSNVLVTVAREPKLLDFGLATSPGTPAPADEEGPLGTLAYAPPEQLRTPSRATPASDVFAFGATLYHALTGRAPFAGPSRSRASQPPGLDAIAPHVPEALIHIVHRCMKRQPEQRLPDGAALLAALEIASRDLFGLDDDNELGAVLRLSRSGRPRPRRRSSVAEGAGIGSVFFGRFMNADLLELAQMIEVSRKTAVLEVTGATGKDGSISFREGRAVRARYGDLAGAEAAMTVLSLPSGQFQLQDGPSTDPPEDDLALTPLLLEIARRRDQEDALDSGP